MTELTVRSGKASDFSDQERQSFIEMAKAGNPANPRTIERNVPEARALVMIERNGALIAIGAAKKPVQSYKTDVFQKAGRPELTNDYPVEIGYIQVVPSERGNGLSDNVLSSLLSSIGSTGCYATTENPAMATVLKRAGLEQVGTPYDAEIGHGKIALYVGKILPA